MSKKMMSLVVLAWAASVAGPAFSQNGPAPTMSIVSPTAAGGTLYLGSFPATEQVAYTVQMNGGGELKSLQNLNVTVNGVSLYNTLDGLNAFNQSNACTGLAVTAPNLCNTSDAYNARLHVPWTVNAVGNYTIIVSAKYRGATGLDEETVAVAQLNAEYPAPPAVANAYINSGEVKLSGKQRGCVISMIADQHAHYSAYGAKGGPYDIGAIKGAVNSFASTCPR